MAISKQCSGMIYVAKAISIVFVINAHMPLYDCFPYEALRMSTGQIGVFVFFLCSGFTYFGYQNEGRVYWRKKLKTLIAPWILMATGTFCVKIMLGGANDDLMGQYIRWVCGIGSPYWYMSILVFCYALFGLLKWENVEMCKRFCMISIGVSLISILLSVFSVVNYTNIFNQYTNIFNWIGIFALGMLIRENDWQKYADNAYVFVISLGMLVLFIVLSAKRESEIQAYIDCFSLPIEILGAICICNISNLLRENRFLIDLGKKSFFIYLLHIQIAGAINTRLPFYPVFFILRPIVCVISCYILAKIIERLLQTLGMLDTLGKIFAIR